MKATAEKYAPGQWGRASLAVLLLASMLLFFSITLSPLSQAYADEPQNTQLQKQQSASENSDTPGYEVYTFSEQDLIDAQTSESGTMIPDCDVPLSSFSENVQSFGNSGGGSSFNTMIALVSIVSMVLMFLLLSIRKSRDYRVIAVRTIAAAFGLVAIATWSLLDQLQVPTTVFNDSSALIAVLFGVYAVIAAGSYAYEARMKSLKKSEHAKLTLTFK